LEPQFPKRLFTFVQVVGATGTGWIDSKTTASALT
jgi:hypothetical protein